MSKQDWKQSQYYQEDFLASHSVQPGSDEARRMTVTSGLRCLELYRRSDPVGSLVKTLVGSSVWSSTQCYLTWKVSATPAKRLYFQLVPSMPPHRRDRCAILAHTNSTRPQGCQQHGTPDASGRRQESHRAACQCGEIVPDTNSTGLPVPRYEPGFKTVQPKDGTALCGWWPTEPNVGRVAHGVPKRVDRLRCLGNAVVPQQFYPVFDAIARVEAMSGGIQCLK